MHICEAHEEMLHDGITPMLLPDTPNEARLLLSHLEIGLYPTVERNGLLYEQELPIGTEDLDPEEKVTYFRTPRCMELPQQV